MGLQGGHARARGAAPWLGAGGRVGMGVGVGRAAALVSS